MQIADYKLHNGRGGGIRLRISDAAACCNLRQLTLISVMSGTLAAVVALVLRREVRVLDHGYDELAADGILVRDLIAGIQSAEVVEDYPGFAKGPCVLVLQHDRDGNPLHALWGISKGETGPAVLVTAYRPDPTRWANDLRRRMK